MSGVEQARTLLLLARKDLKVAAILADVSDPEPEAVGFHLQQATEKALKAWLVCRKVVSPKVHDLSLLLSALEDVGEDVAPFSSMVELNPFAVQFRYALYEDEPFVWAELQDHVSQLMKLTAGDKEIIVNEELSSVTMGRSSSSQSHMMVPDNMASRLHAKVEFQRDHFVLVDQSTNGTYMMTDDGEMVMIYRGERALRGNGYIGLGQKPTVGNPLSIRFVSGVT
ncbi:MAG: HEPN domain-containing protein [Magnetococcales bacterium]|nr:HEPN domain-containing protein [Magnetococcales bacterium]